MFQFIRVNTLPCSLAERQITSDAVSTESVRRALLLYTYIGGVKKFLLPLVSGTSGD